MDAKKKSQDPQNDSSSDDDDRKNDSRPPSSNEDSDSSDSGDEIPALCQSLDSITASQLKDKSKGSDQNSNLKKQSVKNDQNGQNPSPVGSSVSTKSKESKPKSGQNSLASEDSLMNSIEIDPDDGRELIIPHPNSIKAKSNSSKGSLMSQASESTYKEEEKKSIPENTVNETINSNKMRGPYSELGSVGVNDFRDQSSIVSSNTPVEMASRGNTNNIPILENPPFPVQAPDESLEQYQSRLMDFSRVCAEIKRIKEVYEQNTGSQLSSSPPQFEPSVSSHQQETPKKKSKPSSKRSKPKKAEIVEDTLVEDDDSDEQQEPEHDPKPSKPLPVKKKSKKRQNDKKSKKNQPKETFVGDDSEDQEDGDEEEEEKSENVPETIKIKTKTKAEHRDLLNNCLKIKLNSIHDQGEIDPESLYKIVEEKNKILSVEIKIDEDEEIGMLPEKVENMKSWIGKLKTVSFKLKYDLDDSQLAYIQNNFQLTGTDNDDYKDVKFNELPCKIQNCDGSKHLITIDVSNSGMVVCLKELVNKMKETTKMVFNFDKEKVKLLKTLIYDVENEVYEYKSLPGWNEIESQIEKAYPGALDKCIHISCEKKKLEIEAPVYASEAIKSIITGSQKESQGVKYVAFHEPLIER